MTECSDLVLEGSCRLERYGGWTLKSLFLGGVAARFKESDWWLRISLPLGEIRTGKELRRWFSLTSHFVAEEA